jgi:UDP-N-acetylmuramoyl-tripeptide--D-alanyl-D-alanine ligase
MDTPNYTPYLTNDFICSALQIHTPAISQSFHTFTGVTLDSRKVQTGMLFVAIPGEKFDGHQFIESALESGATGVICRRDTKIAPALLQRKSIFYVDDTLKAYRKLAAAWRKEFSIPIVVVAGSAGKTTTKELLAAILSAKWSSVLKTEGSQNGFIGVPMTLLELRPHHRAAVIEVGIDEIGAMDQHMSLVAANAALVTAIGPEHLERLRDLATVAQEEGISLTHMTRIGGTMIINVDDPWIRPHLTMPRGNARKIAFTLQSNSNPAALPPKLDSELRTREVVVGVLEADGKTLTLQGFPDLFPQTQLTLPLLGKHNASNLLAAVTAATALGLTIEEIQQGLKKFKGAAGRSEIHELPNRIQVICDYYNAQPASVAAGLDLLEQISSIPPKGNTWVCLGDMLELGPEEEKFHRELSSKIMEIRASHVLLYGSRMKALADELHQNQFLGTLGHYQTHADLAKQLIDRIQPNDCVLIKGSRGMKMEEVWKILESCVKPKSKESTPSVQESSNRQTDA